jgi:hypothetical protein
MTTSTNGPDPRTRKHKGKIGTVVPPPKTPSPTATNAEQVTSGTDQPSVPPKGRNPQFNWKDCVNNFTPAQTRDLAGERAVAELTIEGLRNRGLIGSCYVEKWKTRCIAFPICDENGDVYRAHCRSPQRDDKDKYDWAFEPKDPLGRPIPALVFGKHSAPKRLIVEGEGDAISVIDKLDLFDEIDKDETCVIITLSSGGPNRLRAFDWSKASTVGGVYVFPQNDNAGRKWLAEVLAITGGAHVIETPPEHKDIGEWIKDGGATVDDIEGAIDFQTPPQQQASTGAPPRQQNAPPPPPPLSGRTVLDFLEIKIDPMTNLVGNRWLTTDGSAFVIAPSGHGKSSLAMQLTICWAIGRSAFGIKPARPLRILFTQSEDDDAETKKFVQMIRKMELSPEELETLKKNTRFEFHRTLSSASGLELCRALDGWLTEWPADIVIINPLSGFLLCDLKNDEKVNQFLRGHLSAVMEKHHSAPLVFHHTPKTNFTRLDNMQWYDWMYAMSGCAGLTNFGRAVLVVAPSKLPGTYRFIAAKRFNEIQWTEREYWFSHSTDKITIDGQESILVQWVPSSEAQIKAAAPEKKARKSQITTEMVLAKMSLVDWVTRQQFIEWLGGKEFGHLGVNPASRMLTDMIDRELVETESTKRAGTCDLKRYRRCK